MYKQPLVSIIVPVYNVGQYLEECLESLVNQTYKNIEILCINDGSTDNSETILETYSYMYSNVYILHKENGGLSSARNAGLNRAKGDYITFVDSDDYLETNVIEKAVQTLEKTNCDLYVYGIQQFADKTTEELMLTNAWFKRRLLPCGKQQLTLDRAFKTNIHVCNKVFRRDTIKDLRFKEGLLYEDIYFTWSCLFRCQTAFYESSIGYHYRVHNNSIMAKTSQDKDLSKALHHFYNWRALLQDAIDDKVVYKRSSTLRKLLEALSLRVKECTKTKCHKIIDEYFNMYRDDLIEANEKPKVSIIVPVYNVERYLEECLDSLVSQTLSPIEIICVDDGSTDSSGAILDEYAKLYPQITVYHKSNGGISSARNYGLAKVKSTYVGFVDSDDYVAKDTFEKAYNAIDTHCVDFVVFGAKPFKDTCIKEGDTAQTVEEFQDWLKCKYSGVQEFNFEKAKNTVQCVWNKLCKTDLCKQIQFGEGLLYEDISFVWTYYMSSTTAEYIEGNYYFYRIRQNSTMDNALKECSYDKAIHHLKNVERIIDYGFFNSDWFTHNIESIQFLLDRHTRRAKRMCKEVEHSKVEQEHQRLQNKLQDIINLYEGDNV